MSQNQQISWILIFLTIVTGTSCQTCAEDLSSIYYDIARNLSSSNLFEPPSNLTLNFLLYSGRTINDYGEYETCQSQNNSHYLSMYFNGKLDKATAPLLFGLCLPITCSAEDAKANTSGIMDIYFRGMAIPLSLITHNETIYFYDPTSRVPLEFSSYVVYVILLLVCSFTFFGTLLAFLRTSASKKKNLPSDTNKLLTSSNEANENEENKQPELRGIKKFLDCFDARKNFDRLTRVKYTDTYDFNLEIFNGIRVFMFMYVIYGHTYLFGTSYVDNLIELKYVSGKWWFLIIFAALYAVDVFFWLGGFLLAYIALSKLEKMRANPKNYFALVAHRLFRIWPTYAVAVLFFWKVLPYLGSGPIWFTVTDSTDLCNDGHVYENLLLIDDFTVEKAAYCFGWAWYLSNDFQMFLLAPIFLWAYISNRKKGKIYIALLIAASWTYSLFFGYHIGVIASPPTTGGIAPSRGFRDYYIKPWVRLPPLYIGVLMGIIYREYREKYGLSYKFGEMCKKPAIKWIIQIFGFAAMMFIVFYPRQVQFKTSEWSPFFHAFWRAFSKSFYVLSLSAMIWPSLLGEDTLMKRFLCHPVFVPFARLGFTAYLVHMFVIVRNYGNQTAAIHFTDENMLYEGLGNIVQSLFGACILSLAVEVPLANMESAYGRRGGKGGKKKEATKNEEYVPPKTIENNDLNSLSSSGVSDAKTSVSEHRPSKKNYTQIVDV